MKKLTYQLFFTSIFLLPFFLNAGDDFTWSPVTEADWAVSQDSAKGIHDAVMIFERISVNDDKLIDEKSYYIIYRRIRILSPEGRKWGDVTAPYLHRKQKVEEIGGRILLPDGSGVIIPQSQIFEKEILKSKGIKIKQKSFSFPAVSEDCIVEYYIKYRLPDTPGLWLIQKDIFLMEGEYIWKFYRGQSLDNHIYNRIVDLVTPNYMWLNTEKKLDVEQRPSIKEPREVVFTIKNVKAFKEEPNSLPDIALRAQLRCYYGQSATPAAYWGDLSKSVSDGLEDFTAKNKRARKVVEDFGLLASRGEKIQAAYNWLQENIRSTGYLDNSDEDFKDNKNVDDVIKRGYGSSSDINKTFYDMLREMNIDAKMMWIIDRDDNFLVYDAKYWQFDRSLVAVPGESGEYEFYNPGALFMPIGSVAWFNEDTYGFLVGATSKQFIKIPPSSSRSNRITRFQQLELDENFRLSGRFIEKRQGHFARSLRLDLRESTETEKTDYLRDKFSELFPNSKADSFLVEGLEDTEGAVTVRCNVSIASAGQPAGGRLILKPYDLFSQHENPFQAEKRKYPIMFNYAKEIVEAMRIDFPGNWKVEGLPSDTGFTNQVGSCQIVFREINNGKSLSVQCIYKLNQPMWNATDYADVRNLFQTQQIFEDIAVVLKKTAEVGSE